MEQDKILYKDFLEGNEEAFNELIKKYKSNLIYFITRYERIWKEPVKYNFEDEIKVTEEDKEKSLTEEEAIAKAKEITDRQSYFVDCTTGEILGGDATK